MKVFFGSALKDMMSELKAGAVASVRLHVLPHVEGKRLRMQAFVTTFCNDQIYEAVIESQADLADVPPERLQGLIDQHCERARQEVAELLQGVEIRSGIIQD